MQFYRRGIANALQAVGHEVYFWSESQKPAFDVFSEIEPDIFWGQTYTLSSAQIKNLRTRPNIKVILEGSQYGVINSEIDLNKYPILVPTNNELKLVEKLVDEFSGKVYISKYYHENRMKETMGLWENLGCELIAIPLAADTFVYSGGQQSEALKCDICFVGGSWEYKRQNLDKYIIPLCHSPGRYNIKIFGNSQWGIAQYLGTIAENTVKDLFASATISPNVHEIHAKEFSYEINERAFKVICAGGFVLDSERVGTVQEDFFPNNEIPYGENPEDYFSKIDFFLKTEHRENYRKKQYETVMREHTYLDRCADLFRTLGLPSEKFVQKKRELYGL